MDLDPILTSLLYHYSLHEFWNAPAFFFQFLTIPGRIKDRFNADLMVFDEVYVFL